jgi:hypothetical protein
MAADPSWTDFPGFVRHVRAACARLGAPQPTLRVLELEYPQRCAELARARAVDEVQTWRDRRERVARLEVAR